MTIITVVTVADFPYGMVRAGAWPRNEGGPQPPAPSLLQTASPYDLSGSGWGQNIGGSEIRVLRRNPSIGALAGSLTEAVRASLRAMIDFRRPQFASLRPQRTSKSASSSTPPTIKSKVPGVGSGSTIRPSPYSSFRDT